MVSPASPLVVDGLPHSDDKMNILFALLDLPFPPDRGQRMRNWGLLRVLAEQGHAITAIGFSESADPSCFPSELRAICRQVISVPPPAYNRSKWKAIAGRVLGLASPMPYGAWRFRSAEYQDQIGRALSSQKFDVIIWDELYNLANFVENPPAPVLLNTHDFVRELWQRFATVERNPLKRAYARLEYKKTARWERKVCAQVSEIIACSERDAKLYREAYPGLPVSVVPNVVDAGSYEPAQTDDGQTVLFVGGMDWLPNRDAVSFFVSAIWPKIREEVPSARFVIAGSQPDDAFRSYLSAVPGITCAGRVPDVRPFISQAAVCVVPLRIGSGTRMKILEAGAAGKAIVSTRIGAEGLDFQDGSEICLADTPEEFAAATVALMKDAERRASMGQAARECVDRSYSYAALKQSLTEALTSTRPRVHSSL